MLLLKGFNIKSIVVMKLKGIYSWQIESNSSFYLDTLMKVNQTTHKWGICSDHQCFLKIFCTISFFIKYDLYNIVCQMIYDTEWSRKVDRIWDIVILGWMYIFFRVDITLKSKLYSPILHVHVCDTFSHMYHPLKEKETFLLLDQRMLETRSGCHCW